MRTSVHFFVHDPATTAIYTLSYTTLFRSAGDERAGRERAGEWIAEDGLAAAAHGGRRQDGALRQAGPGHLQRQRRSEEHTSELQSHSDLVCRLLLEKKKKKIHECSSNRR